MSEGNTISGKRNDIVMNLKLAGESNSIKGFEMIQTGRKFTMQVRTPQYFSFMLTFVEKKN